MSSDRYEEAVRTTWRHDDEPGRRGSSRLMELVRYATLAPSSHNTQCWQFRLEERAITILPDFRRRCPAVDPDDHHLFASLGCAAENLVQAAPAYGLQALPDCRGAPPDGIRVTLEPARPARSPLFEAIPLRQSTRAEYDGRPLTAEELQQLEQASGGTNVRLLLLTDRKAMAGVLECVLAANTAQMRDPAFVQELKSWIRFSAREAVRTRDGLFARASGNPAAPRWLGRILFDLFFTLPRESDKYARQVLSSTGIAVIVADRQDPQHWIAAGRAFERFALQATALGIRTALLNQPVEVAAIRAQLAGFLGLGQLEPDLVVRFGRGPGLPQSLRRPVEDVVVG